MPRILLILCIAAVPAAAQTFEWATFGPAGGAAIVAVDPQNPRVLYAAGNGSGLNLFSGSPLFKSTDGGSNWTLTGLKGDSAQAYIRRFRPSYEALRRMPEYDLFSYIKQTVQIWRERQRLGPGRSLGSGGG